MHIVYALNTCVIAPSPSDLHKWLGICTNCAQSKSVKFCFVLNVCVSNPRISRVYITKCQEITLNNVFKACLLYLAIGI